MTNQSEIVWVVVSIIGLLFVLGLVLGYSIALHHYFPQKIRKGRTPGQLIDALAGNDRAAVCMLIDHRVSSARDMLWNVLFGLVPIGFSLFVMLAGQKFFVNVGIVGWVRVLVTILFFVGLTLLLLFTTLKSPFRNFQEPEPTPKENLFDTELIRLQRTKEVLPHIYSQHFWLKLHRNPRKRKQCNHKYLRCWFRMMNLPYDASDDPPQKKQYYLPPYYRRGVRDCT